MKALSARTRCSIPADKLPPLGGGEDPRDDVEGDEALRGFALAIDRESDALAPEHGLGLLQGMGHILLAQRPEPLLDAAVRVPDGSPFTLHFIEDPGHPPPYAALQ